MSIRYTKGDVTNPTIEGRTYLIHVCNDRGGFGKGVALAIKKKWPIVCSSYKEWFHSAPPGAAAEINIVHSPPFELGQIQVVRVQPQLCVVNMIAQSGYGRFNTDQHASSTPNATPPIRYEALAECLKQVAELAKRNNAKVIGPRFGSGLSQGSWPKIEEMITVTMSDIAVTIYDL